LLLTLKENDMSCLRRPSRPVVTSLCLGLFLTVLAAASSGAPLPKGPGDISHEIAEAKARFYARIPVLESTPTTNQSYYDAVYYRLDLNIDSGSQTVSGTVRMVAEVVTGPLASADIDLYDNMTVSAVTCGGSVVTYTHSGDILSVDLDRSYAVGETFTLDITYSGTPDASAGAFDFDSHGGNPMIWSLSEPFGARTWWPCKDYSDDKADSVDIWVTVRDDLIVASNGTLRDTVTGGGNVTYKWHEQYPIATYLVSVAIHPYTVFSNYYRYSPTDSMECRYFVFPDHYDAVQATYAMVPDMITTYASLFGEYPFLEEKYGHAEFTWGGGMEHQTITSLGGWSEYLIVHELAHMWWGDMITCNDFHHIWLNEGFATYSEALWAEQTYGEAEYKNQMDYAKYFGAGTVYVPDLSDWNRIFDAGLSYDKASWILHMLRGVVGDSTFFDILRTYYASEYQYSSCTTEQFRDLCESVSGRDLDAFFHQWVYEEGFPFYYVSWSYTPGMLSGYEISLDIEQLQTNWVFTMPIQITVTTPAGDTTLVVEDSLAVQNFTLVVNDEPLALEIDKDEWILRMISEGITDATFDRGILVVNGVDWNSYGSEITSAYEDSIFWGSLPISFWDNFGTPAGGYPSTLPAPLGHGTVPADTLRQFSSVVWIGNNYNGDLDKWYGSPVLGYLNAGGNLLLMTRMGQDFVYEALRSRLGIVWTEDRENTTRRATSVYTGLVDMPRLGTQSYNAVFDSLDIGENSTLLFVQLNLLPSNPGLGVWNKPPSGGTLRADGGQFVFISGRPYRYSHSEMRANTEYILREFFGEPYNPSSGAGEIAADRVRLMQNAPNPFIGATRIAFSLPQADNVRLSVYDVRGREIKTLADGRLDAGPYSLSWDGTDAGGRSVASGIYYYRLVTGADVMARKMVLLR
jgi:aminopeptidase N